MKKLVILTMLLTIILSGCSSIGLVGSIYTNVTTPVNATSNEKGPKTGQAKCISVLGIVATGDCSIDAAAKNGNISEIKSVDVKTFSILGLFSEETTIVTGN
ncbi:MAG: TRL-like family protein [Candidatus Mucispirillum faecigallinarum]|nr:TRL-like family protein [Candidatus Mucispirillum faecigallinarum]